MKMCVKFIIFILLFIDIIPLEAESIDIDSKYDEPESLENSQLGIHGLLDVVFKNDYITPRGLLVTDTGLTTQVLVSVTLDIYKNSNSTINNIALNFGAWNDIWSQQHHPQVGNWNEFDWFAGANITFAKKWNFSIQYLEFLSPPGNFKAEQNIEFLLSYDDSDLKLPISFNPYMRFFWAVSGDSTVVVGKRGKTFDIELGVLPIWDLKQYGIPITLIVPTWITVGPPSFWNGGEFGLKNVKNHFGVFSTGLKGSMALECIPKKLGNWYIDAGFQYYYLINTNLLQAQKFTLILSSIKHAHRNVVVFFTGFGFGF